MNGRRGSLTGADITVGALMSLAALVHAGEHVRAGRPHDVLWICNVVALLVVIASWIAALASAFAGHVIGRTIGSSSRE